MIKFFALPTVYCAENIVIRKFLIGTEQGKQLPNLMEDMEQFDIFADGDDRDLRKFVADYRSMLQMCKITNVSAEDIEEFTMSALDIVIALTRSSFFGENCTLPVSFHVHSVILTLKP